jgi:hypothetical protein
MRSKAVRVLSSQLAEFSFRRILNVCFSATANFVGSGVLGAVGAVTLTKVKHRRELLFASLPLLFAVHQFTEGFVWLGLDGILSSRVTHVMGEAFALYAQGLLPFLMPLSIWLFEPDRKSRRRMLPFLVIGSLCALYMLWALVVFPLKIYVEGNSIVYVNDGTNYTSLAVVYVIATCGSLFFSKVRPMVAFGWANLVILLAVMAWKRYAFTSLWCAYAAVASVIILGYFWKSAGSRPFRYLRAL